nr:MAG TPA: hypothetical protein [Caudoviricetes sp.]
MAYRIRLVCRSKKCENYGQVVESIYEPVEIAEDE